MNYESFIINKTKTHESVGFDCDSLPSQLFDYQSAIVKWALKRGRAAIFADTGLGKSFMQTAWADEVRKKTGKSVLIVAPLCVAPQTVNEGAKIGIGINYCRDANSIREGLVITNYEMVDQFEPLIKDGFFSGIVLDESSILKHQDSKTRTKMIDLCVNIPYRLSCTATPSPNDFMELGSQAEFLGLVTAVEMLATFFTHDSGETSKWRLKGHAKSKFWEWLATWSVFIKKPSDIGFQTMGISCQS